jgi:hypothetical protein
MPPCIGGWCDLPWWIAGVFLVLLIYRTMPRLGGFLLIILALGALVRWAQRRSVAGEGGI